MRCLSVKYNVLLVFVLFLFSCNESKDNKDKKGYFLSLDSTQLTTINIDNVKEEVVLPLSKLIESLEVIPLENKEEAILKIGRIDVSENYIGLLPYGKDCYKLFYRNGKYLCDVGSVGQGPGEYNVICSSQLDENADRIYLHTFDGMKIFTFDLQGNFLASESIKLSNVVPKSTGYVDSENKKVIIAALPFKGEDTRNVCWVQDFMGEIIQSIPADGYAVIPDYSNEISSYRNTNSFDFQIAHFYQEKQDTLYHYNVKLNRIEPVLTFIAPLDPGNIIYRYVELPNSYFLFIKKTKMNANPDNDIENVKVVLVDKQTKHACYVKVVNDFLGGIKVDPYYLSFRIMNGYFTSAMEPVELKEQLEEVLENKKLNEDVKERVEKLYKSLNVNDNNIIMIGELKR